MDDVTAHINSKVSPASQRTRHLMKLLTEHSLNQITCSVILTHDIVDLS